MVLPGILFPGTDIPCIWTRDRQSATDHVTATAIAMDTRRDPDMDTNMESRVTGVITEITIIRNGIFDAMITVTRQDTTAVGTTITGPSATVIGTTVTGRDTTTTDATARSAGTVSI